MRRNGILVGIVIVIFVAGAYSQHLSHQVLVSAAGVAVGGGMNYSQTMGETAVEIVGAYDHILTQGFQQPRLRLTTVTPPMGSGVKVYPNPAIDFINVEMYGETPRSFIITIITLSGIAVYSEERTFTGKYWEVLEIPVAGFARGIYFVRAVSKDRVVDRSFKIEKM